MKTHELKTTQPHFEHVRSGVKRAEIRRDDRGFAVGDVLVLKEYDPATDSYSGREVEVRVTHVLAGYEALAPGFVMLSIEPQPSALATARAEAALAERAAISTLVGTWWTRHAYEIRAAIDARTTPATLSTDTLAAIAETRGLRVLTAERVAELEGAAKDASAAVIAEREACAVRIKQAADQLDAAAARIGELVAERDMAQAMIDELNGDLALVARERNEARAVLVTARAEAALAEREACAQWFEDRAASYERRATLVADNPASFGGAAVAEDVVESLTTAGAQARLDARTIRARTTPDTLSTDTLAAIAEARGLRVVEPELVAEVPVLQWECDLHSIARFGQWVLEADAEAWAVWVDSPGPAARLLVAEATTERTERAVNRSAAEDALRKLGVAFRTE